jgi:hypothetical protein
MFATNTAKLERIAAYVTEKLSNYVVGATVGIVPVYQRRSCQNEMRAVEFVHKHLDSLITTKTPLLVGEVTCTVCEPSAAEDGA